MKATILYRIASVLLIVYAGGNTFALQRFWHVAASMNPVPFPVGHRPLTYAQVVFGLWLFCVLSVLLGAYLAWHLGTLARTNPQAIGALGWVLFIYQVAVFYMSSVALTGLVLVLSAGIAICIGWASWLSTGAARAPAAAN
ncbi:MAG: hypothetical protein ACYCO5_09195 [Acidobacteriaceae bacterium]